MVLGCRLRCWQWLSVGLEHFGGIAHIATHSAMRGYRGPTPEASQRGACVCSPPCCTSHWKLLAELVRKCLPCVGLVEARCNVLVSPESLGLLAQRFQLLCSCVLLGTRYFIVAARAVAVNPPRAVARTMLHTKCSRCPWCVEAVHQVLDGKQPTVSNAPLAQRHSRRLRWLAVIVHLSFDGWL